MKTVIFLCAVVFLFGCNKPDIAKPTEILKPYLGVYTGANEDTCYVTDNGSFTKIQWRYVTGFKITFDSVLVTNDSLFTVNEYVDDEGISPIYRFALGGGSFPTNMLKFKINVDGGVIDFNGVKQR